SRDVIELIPEKDRRIAMQASRRQDIGGRSQVPEQYSVDVGRPPVVAARGRFPGHPAILGHKFRPGITAAKPDTCWLAATKQCRQRIPRIAVAELCVSAEPGRATGIA